MVIKTILIFLIALLGYSEWLTGTSYLQRPIVLGPLVGLVMGDMVTGTIMGATMELAMVGAISVGAYNPPDTISGTILGVSLAMQAGADASAALTLGIPIATDRPALDTALGQPVMLLLVHRIDKNVEDGDNKAITRNMLIAGYAQSWCGLLIIPLASSCRCCCQPAEHHPRFRQTGMDVAAAFCPHSALRCWLR
ncbi:MAG: PTS sugar transporter subunit IIC [Collinsella sp.]